MKSDRGFVTIAFLSIFPLLVIAGFATLLYYSILKSDLTILNICRAQQLQIHNQVGLDLKKLLKMNPTAIKLRASEKLAEQQLQLAIASGNPYLIAAAETRLAYIKGLRLKLAFRQNTTIQSANTKLRMATPQIANLIKQGWYKQMSALSPWITNHIDIERPQIPTLAVRPDISDIAPAYEPLPHFEDLQSWVHSWQLQLEIKKLQFHGRLKRSCSTSLYQKESEWVSRLKVDKFSSKLSL